MTLFPGEAVLKINGETRALRLTLGALAELEQSIGDGDFETLRERLKAPSIGDLLLILHALIAGGGDRLTLEILKSSDIDFRAAAAAIGEAFKTLGPDASPLGEAETASFVVSGEGSAVRNRRETLSNSGQETPHPKAPRAFDLSQGRGEKKPSPPKPRARRSPGQRGSAPESSR